MERRRRRRERRRKRRRIVNPRDIAGDEEK